MKTKTEYSPNLIELDLKSSDILKLQENLDNMIDILNTIISDEELEQPHSEDVRKILRLILPKNSMQAELLKMKDHCIDARNKIQRLLALYSEKRLGERPDVYTIKQIETLIIHGYTH